MDHLSKPATEQPSAPKKPHRLKRLIPAGLALVVVLGMIAVLWFVFRKQLIPAVPVETGRVVLLERETGVSATAQQGPSEMLFQASGWIEPDPWPNHLAVKEEGYVEEVLIKEGETVTNGQLVATLDDTDARLAYRSAQADVKQHEAALAAVKNAAEAAGKEAEAAQFRIEAVTARLAAARDTWDRYSKTAENVISLNERAGAEQAVNELQADEFAARSVKNALDAKATQAASKIAVAEAALEAARNELDTAGVALERTRIHAGMDGVVLHRFVAPGDKRILGGDDPNSSIIASLYNPDELQVRVDVPIAEAGKLNKGQPARIFTALLPGTSFTGRVTRIIGMADLQRNTLQAKVAIDAPDPRIRPDVLCRVEFWSRPDRTGAETAMPSGSRALWIPEAALASNADEQDVWVVDPLGQTASRKTVALATSARDGYRRVADGLKANEQVILNAPSTLEEGARVKEMKR